ncbi:hypothetical protein DN730_15670 [Marinomonas piezotolerans]|uniref:DUF1853 domain-containing protein n=1 Tax=Marinomonas piezotolerans TaxID=2213058 RepID=A0A370U5T7_9GAMM|nr:DUF1853 family protein [Marinomonas piezotolerans]RDL43144.1 hypothetical protein DN730_15670 [Marinomonas piezotolerans]
MVSTGLPNDDHLIQDLWWLLAGEEIIVADRPLSDFLLDNWQAKFFALQKEPSPLSQYVAESKSHFLGAYFERLFSFAVLHFTSLQVVAEHQQIFKGKTTKGELDLVAKDLAGNIILFEVALKFYLERPDLVPNQWIGPNKNDSLHKKVSHARAHQLTILDDAEGSAWLKENTGQDKCDKNLLIFGRLFRRFSPVDESGLESFSGNAGWLYFNELCKLSGERLLYQLAQKPLWVTENKHFSGTRLTLEEVIDLLTIQFQSDNRPQLYSCRSLDKDEKSASFWLFVCPDSW